MYFQNGNYYEGDFKDDYMFGEGELHANTHGMVLVGIFQYGVMISGNYSKQKDARFITLKTNEYQKLCSA